MSLTDTVQLRNVQHLYLSQNQATEFQPVLVLTIGMVNISFNHNNITTLKFASFLQKDNIHVLALIYTVFQKKNM